MSVQLVLMTDYRTGLCRRPSHSISSDSSRGTAVTGVKLPLVNSCMDVICIHPQ